VRLIALLVLLCVPEQHGSARFPANCMHLTEASYAETPLKNGEPDWSNVKVYGLVLDKKCWTLNISK
jgi:hypothetical protein